jgi:protein-disulfide isomerase
MRWSLLSTLAAVTLLASWLGGCKHADSTKSAGQESGVGAEIPPPLEATLTAASATVRQPELPPGVQVQDLDDAEKKVLLEIVTEQFDPCGKTQSFLDALRSGSCPIAPKLVATVVEALRAGQGKKQVVATLLHEIERINTVVQIAVKDAPRKGPVDAKVVVVTFSDFECPFCRRAIAPLDKLQERYNFALYYKFFPLKLSHPNAEGAARAAWAAHQQGKFWPMHDLLFANQTALDWPSVQKYAAKAGLDAKKFEADFRSPASQAAVSADEKAGEEAGVDGTPTFFVNGRKAETLRQIEDLVREAMQGGGLPLPAPLSATDLGDAAAPAPAAAAPSAAAPAAGAAAPAAAGVPAQ